MQVTDKTVYADFLHMKERPDVVGDRMSIPLGEAVHAQDLSKLHEGEQVTLVEPGSFRAKAWVHIIERNGARWYYGVLDEEPQEDTSEHAISFYA